VRRIPSAGLILAYIFIAWGCGGEKTKPDPPTLFVAVSVGYAHRCGVTTAGAAYCWGSNGFGQLGDETRTGRSRPVLVAGGVQFTIVDAGSFHTCGVTAAGVAYCWGANSSGQLGDGTTN
jgi:alpha-tubulin suppressor-like RCC1 family protein